MLLQQQRIVLEETGARAERLALDRAALRRMVHTNVGAERNAAVFERPPSQIGVLAKRPRIELRVEAADGLKCLAPQEQVRGHEPNAFEASVRHRAIPI